MYVLYGLSEGMASHVVCTVRNIRRFTISYIYLDTVVLIGKFRKKFSSSTYHRFHNAPRMIDPGAMTNPLVNYFSILF